jgi:hypothetical protein
MLFQMPQYNDRTKYGNMKMRCKDRFSTSAFNCLHLPVEDTKKLVGGL